MVGCSDRNTLHLQIVSYENSAHIDPQCELYNSFNSAIWERGHKPDLIFVSESIAKMYGQSVMGPIIHTQHRPICIREVPVIVPNPTLFRRHFNLRKADWHSYSIELDKHIEDVEPAPNDIAYKRWSCHKRLCKLCRTFLPPSMGARYTVFWASRPCGLAGWLALLLTKAGDVETNPGPTTSHKRVWICDICYKQIHVRKQISTRCNGIEHWLHLRCAGFRQAQYTDTWTCHLHRESRLAPHADITPLKGDHE